MSGMELLLADRHGVYIPQTFAEDFGGDAWGIDEDSHDWLALLAGPETDAYWDAWDSVLSRATHTDSKGNVWTLHQDGDLWAVCPELMTDEEYEEYFGEPREQDVA